MACSHKILHDRPNCIGCGLCVNVAPEFWKMADDGKSNVLGAQSLPDGTEVLEIEEKDLACNMDAAEICPVNVIHLVEIGSGKQLI